MAASPGPAAADRLGETPVPFIAVLEKRALVDEEDIVTGVLHVTGAVCEAVAL